MKLYLYLNMKKIIIIAILWITIFQANGQTAMEFFKRGIEKEKNADIEAAIKDYSKAIQLDSNFSEAYFSRAIMLLTSGSPQRINRAALDLDKAIKLKPDGNAKAYYARAILYSLEEGNDNVVIFVCNKAIKINPSYSEAYLLRGTSKSNLKDNKGALEDFEKAIQINPNYTEAYFQMGNIKTELNDDKGAISDFTKAIQLGPDGPKFLNRALAKFRLEDYRGAILDFTNAIELINPKIVKAYKGRGLCKGKLGDYRGAIADYSEVIEINPKDGEAYYLRGISKFMLKDKNSGCLDLSKAGELGYEEAYDTIKKYCN